MALRVWLPLNGSLENIGISGDIYTTSLTSGNMWASEGKIANQALQLTKSQQILPANNTSCMYGAKEISWAFWVKVNTAWDTQWLDGIRWITTDGSSTATCRQEFYTNCTLIGMWFGGGSISGKSFTPGIWTHLAGTLNYNTGETNFYINGVLTGSTTNATTTHYCRGDFYIGDNGVNILENDVRIYDHCLSAKEIKELAQGLVLHYKLDNSTIESSQNLITTADCFENATCFNGATSKYGYGTTTDIYKTSGVFEGRWSTKIYMGTAGQNAYPYVYFTPFNAAGTTIQSLSFDYFPTSQTGLIPYSYNGAYNWTYVVNGVRGTANNAGTCPTLSVNLNQWNHIEITAIKTDTTNTTRGIGYVRIGTTAHTSTTTDYWLFANVQVENKDHATQYMGIGGSRTGYAIDSSGYNNNGLIKNSPSIVAENSPRYTTSTKFNGTNDCIYLPEFYLGNEWSYGCWINTPTSTTRGWEAVMLFNNTGSDADSQLAFWVHQQENRFESLANTKYTSTISYTNYYGSWHHFFATYNGNILTTYIDGTVVNTKTITDARYNASHLTIGARCTNATATSFANWFEGQLSDVRVYVTPLSADDVLDLYHTPTNIDNLGNLHTFQLEENGLPLSIKQSGVTESPVFTSVIQLPDGSQWLPLVYHNNKYGTNLFSTSDNFNNPVYHNDECWCNFQLINTVERYSTNYEFLVMQQTNGSENFTQYRWAQPTNPWTATWDDVNPSSGNITHYDGTSYGGMYKFASTVFMCFANGSNGNWFGCAQARLWGGTAGTTGYIPGYNGQQVSQWQNVYIRIKNNIYRQIKEVSMATDFIEK